MLHILTDEQIDPDVAVAARRRTPDLQIIALRDWCEGHFIGASDEDLLREAARRGNTLLSFDLRTIPPLLRDWGERGIDHGGVIFVDHKGFSQNDVGGIAQALCELWELQGKLDWKNRCFFLTPKR
jgi:hypothetical protein